MRLFLSALGLSAMLASALPVSASELKSLPAFSLPDLEGKVHGPKEWVGKVVIVDFWATWCTGCRETIPVLQRLQDKYGKQGLVVAGVSLDKGPKEKIAKFARKLKMGYQILWDAEDTQSKVFGFEGLPSVYVFGRDGALQPDEIIRSVVGVSRLGRRRRVADDSIGLPCDSRDV